MIRRTLDATHLNRVANDPTVRPWLGGDGNLDLGSVIGDPRNVALETEHGGFLFAALGGGAYEGHSLFLPAGRGRGALAAARGALLYIFTATDGSEVLAKVPEPNKAVGWLTRALGFRHRFTMEHGWLAPDGPKPVHHYGLTIGEWTMRSAEALAAGEAFHDLLDAIKERAGSLRVKHADEPAHDRAAGAAMLMVRAGNVAKAVRSYNAWAAFAGYQTIELVSTTPPVIDVRDAVLEVTPTGLEALLCRQV